MTTVFANLTMTSKVYHAPLTEAGKALPPGEYVLWAVPVSEQARFAQTYCSQCGREQGPGDSGVSRCADHVTVEMVDAAMVEMSNIHPPLKRSECERLLRAAMASRLERPPAVQHLPADDTEGGARE